MTANGSRIADVGELALQKFIKDIPFTKYSKALLEFLPPQYWQYACCTKPSVVSKPL